MACLGRSWTAWTMSQAATRMPTTKVSKAEGAICSLENKIDDLMIVVIKITKIE